MTENWIMTNLPLDELGNVLLQTFQNDATITISPTDLSNLTTSVSDPPTYAALSTLPIASEGWQTYFDAWKSKGLI